MLELVGALTIGFFGSAHCIGMCGPIAFALPLNRKNSTTKLLGVGVYSFARLLTYFALGCLFGIIGKGIAISGFQQLLSIIIGISLIASIVLPRFINNKLNILPRFTLLIGQIKQGMGKRFAKQSNENLFVIGLLNGLLPCGMVYIGLAGATSMLDPMFGGLFMVAFGVGTLPVMTSISILGANISNEKRSRIQKAVPVLIAIMGVVFILRGMNLGIPYLSPQISGNNTEIVDCN